MGWRRLSGPWRPSRRGCAAVAAAGVMAPVAVLLLTRTWGVRGTAAREDRYDAYIWESATRHGISPYLVKAVVWRESRFRALAEGGHGEVGLMQITRGAVIDWSSGTGQRLPNRGLLFDPRLNIEIGTWYLAKALYAWGDYRSFEVLALAQYNAGRENAKRWAPRQPGDKVTLDAVSFPGTREYIRSVRERRQRFEQERTSRGQR